jgi:hypothetical protein
MNTKKRYALILKPTPKIKPWLKKILLSYKYSLASIHNIDVFINTYPGGAYLLPSSIHSQSTATEFFLKNYQHIFKKELAHYVKEKELWPEDLSFEHFNEMFNIEFHSRMINNKNL